MMTMNKILEDSNRIYEQLSGGIKYLFHELQELTHILLQILKFKH